MVPNNNSEILYLCGLKYKHYQFLSPPLPNFISASEFIEITKFYELLINIQDRKEDSISFKILCRRKYTYEAVILTLIYNEVYYVEYKYFTNFKYLTYISGSKELITHPFLMLELLE